MPPRFAYWTIILDGAPTSFRTKERDEILPLFNQLKAKNPGALLKWFSGGRLWDSPEQAKELRGVEKVRRFRDDRAQQMKAERESGEDPLAEFRRQRGRPADGSDQPVPEPSDRSRGASFGSPADKLAQDRFAPREGQAPSDPLAEFRRQHGRPADGSDQRPPAPSAWSPGSEDRGAPRAPRREGRGPGSSERRNKDWRPGGEHKDPRDKYKLPPGEARKRWKDRNLGPRVPKPFGSPSTRGGDDRSVSDRRTGLGDRPAKPFGSKPGGGRPFGDRPQGDRPPGDRPYGDRPRGPKPFGSKPGGGKPFGSKPGGDRPYGDRPRGPKPFGSKPGGDRPWGGKPRGPGGGRPFGDRPQGDRPQGDRPYGDRPRGPKPFGSKSGGDRPYGGKPRGPKPFGSKPGGGKSFGARPRGPGKPPGGPRRKG